MGERAVSGFANNIDPLVGAYADGFFTCAALIAALFFLRFWRRSGDGLFLSFSIAFVLMAGNSLAPVLLRTLNDQEPAVYLLRLAAFLVIIFAIWRKNLRGGAGR
jgi:FtsH-binding integral membrane protein